MNLNSSIKYNLNEYDFNLEEQLKKFIKFNFFLFIIALFLFFLIGCSSKPQVIVKYKYIKEPCPKLQTVDLKELKLNKEKPLKINFKVKSKTETKGK